MEFAHHKELCRPQCTLGMLRYDYQHRCGYQTLLKADFMGHLTSTTSNGSPCPSTGQAGTPRMEVAGSQRGIALLPNSGGEEGPPL